MELKRVEIMGFKSFPEKIQVEFGKGITAIVGPNGSGKSNISDAVRWVLGEQSAKTLRGAKMEDVIFAGTERRKPVNFAQVTLVLDNHDKKMAVDFNEVAISRRVYRSGESEYTINGGRCRLRDVQEMLMDTGIGKDGYSVIGQGQIDQLLSSKPQDRRMIFEEAAGIVKYKSRKEQAEKQLAEEADNLSRVQDILEELTSRLEPLEKQAETAETYLSLKEELKTYEVASFLGEYQELQGQYERVSRLLEELSEQIEGSRKDQQQAKERSEQYAKEADEARKGLTVLYEEHNQLRLQKESNEGDKRVMLQQAEGNEKEIDSLQQRLEDVKQRMSSRIETVKKEEIKLQQLEAQTAKEENEQKAFLELLGKKEEEQQQLTSAYDEVKNRVSSLEQELSMLRAQAERHALVLEQDLSQQEQIDHKGAELSQQMQEQNRQIEDERKKQEEAVQAAARALQEEQELSTQTEQMRQTIREKQKQQESLILQMRELQGRMKWLQDMESDYEGFSGSVKAVMQLKKQDPNRYQTVHGTVADILQVPGEYTLAIEIALGAAIQNIIVQDTKAAKELIEMLRSTKRGRATFLPLDSVTARSPIQNESVIKAMKGVCGFAHELVEYAPVYQKIISRQLSNVVVAEDFESASQVSRRYGNAVRVVTLKGDIFNIGGSITGGSTTAKAGGILSRKDEIKRLQQQLTAKREEGRVLQAEVSALSEQRQNMSLKLEKKQNERQAAEQNRMQGEQRLQQLSFILQHMQAQMEETEQSRKELTISKEQHEKQERQSRKQLTELEESQEQLRQEAETAQHAVEVLSAQIEAEKGELSQKKIALAGLRQQQQFMQRTVDWESQEIENLAQEADAILEDSQQRREQVEAAHKQIDQIEQQQTQLEKEIEEKAAQMKQLEAQRAEKDRRRDESIKEAEETLRSFSALEKEQVRLENQAARAKKDLNDLQDRIWEEYELTYGAAKALSEKNGQQDLGSQTAMKKRVSQLKEAIRRLGNVNVDAIEELLALRERCTFLNQQRDDIAQSEASLREVIEQLTQKMEEQFIKGFSAIAKTFNEVFQKLFGGGQGILRLGEGENALEAGIEIIAQPPGKKLQSMMLLSGGERALTAISLLFAIHQLNPAPFCILDEIEAALDDANVGRYADYLKEMCEHTQFIIITHRKGTMEAADTMYGVTMEEKGVSKCISVQFAEAQA
ncbi:MAG: chromosome segregation protein SMC [Lachnospiraceae bacterium]|jgi:chromosome segregation protein|nr:chromosome segregation protein SMC [Lachnospiraceae bacterium]